MGIYSNTEGRTVITGARSECMGEDKAGSCGEEGGGKIGNVVMGVLVGGVRRRVTYSSHEF